MNREASRIAVLRIHLTGYPQAALAAVLQAGRTEVLAIERLDELDNYEGVTLRIEATKPS